jgi:hypothetical protein
VWRGCSVCLAHGDPARWGKLRSLGFCFCENQSGRSGAIPRQFSRSTPGSRHPCPDPPSAFSAPSVCHRLGSHGQAPMRSQKKPAGQRAVRVVGSLATPRLFGDPSARGVQPRRMNGGRLETGPGKLSTISAPHCRSRHPRARP